MNATSNLPTLMIKGNLKPVVDKPECKKELDEWVPIDYIIEWFRARAMKTCIANRVLVLKSETASGKSTLLPAELYKRLLREKGKAGIICTQPRVATAIENVVEILKHNSHVMRLGESIGWSTKYNKFRLKNVGLLSATIGTLTQMLRTSTDEEIIKRFKYILVDETHERDLQTDMVIPMLKNLITRNQNNPDCPFVVLMSATFEPQPFLDYFGVPAKSNFIWCGGQTAKIDEMWDWNEGRTVNDYPRAAATVVEKIVNENEDDDPSRGDILIFMPGKAEFQETARWLKKLNEKLARENKKVFSVLQIDGIAFQTQNRDFMLTVRIPISEHEITISGKKYVPSRRVIISTNVAETGLTLDNLKYVIDSGYNREIEYNPVLGIRALITKPSPHSRTWQRRGRAGRKFDGVFYPLYPKYIYDRLPEQQFPQILVEDISSIALEIVAEQLRVKKLSGDKDPSFSVQDIDMLDVPTPDALSACIEKLYTLGFISPLAPKWEPKLEDMLANEESVRFGLTKLGALARAFPLMTPESARMIFSAYFWECSVLDIITIAAYLSMDSKSFTASAQIDDPDVPPPRVDINWQAVYKIGLPGWIASPGLLYKIRLLIADEFINGIILFNAVKHVVASSVTKDSLVNLQKWCTANNLSLKACLDLIRARDDIIEQMLTAGLEIFEQEENSIANSTADDFMTAITRIKYCIYDGYRNNLIVRNGTEYRTLSGVKILPPKLFREDERKLAEKNEYGFVMSVLPSYILYHELSLKLNRKTATYDIAANTISSMDGYVSVDADFSI